MLESMRTTPALRTLAGAIGRMVDNTPCPTDLGEAGLVMKRIVRQAKKAEAVASAAKSAAHHAETLAIVKTGKCPTCGAGLRRNSSMTGWWQCEQLGAVGFRKDPNLPSCDWQGFTS
jgi:hypothetical protein